MSHTHTLDVRLEDTYSRGHLPDALNNPVFQMGFTERIPDSWSKEDEITVVGEDDESAEAEMAVEKLHRAGYTHAHVLEGGIRAWIDSGKPVVDVSAPPPPSDPLQGELPVDLKKSVIQWTGRNLLSRHDGTLQFAKAMVTFENGNLSGGEFVVDWDSLACLDLAGDPLHDVLLTHLRDHDFFDVDAWAPPTILITGVEKLAESGTGHPDLRITVNLTLKGRTRPITFDATTGRNADGHFALQAAFDFDRTQWDVRYGSGRFFKGLGMHLVNDRIETGLTLVTT